jgi:hypothetical protein
MKRLREKYPEIIGEGDKERARVNAGTMELRGGKPAQ